MLRVEALLGWIVLDLDIDTHPLASRQCICKQWDEVGQITERRLSNCSAVGKFLVMKHGKLSVDGLLHVEFNPISTQLARTNEGFDCVFREGRRRSSVSKDESHRLDSSELSRHMRPASILYSKQVQITST